MRTLLGLTVANIRSLVRDRAALFWTIFFPIMFVFLFGSIFGGSSDTRISVGYVDQDGTAASAGLRQAFGNVTLLNLREGSLDDEKAAMQRGEVSAVIVIPKGLQDALAQARTGAKHRRRRHPGGQRLQPRTITSSPSPTPIASGARWRAAVAELRATGTAHP